jgi:ferritin
MDQCIANALNKQILVELDAAYLYMQMADWLEKNSLKGFGTWLRKQAHEEVGHAMILFNFLKDRNAAAPLGNVRQQKYFFSSVKDVMDKLLSQGKRIAGNITKILAMAQASEDKEAAVLLAWFAAVQLEEEELVTNILLRVNNTYRDAVGDLQEIDTELAARQGTIPELLKSQRKHGVA